MIRQRQPYVQSSEPPRHVIHATLAELFVLIAGIAFTVLAIAAHRSTPLPGDLRFARWVQGFDGRFANYLASFGNWFGRMPVIAAAALVIAGLFATRRCWLEAGFVLIAYACEAVNALLKVVIAAPRPTFDLVRVTEHAAGWGFPSGHVMGTSLALGSAALMLQRRLPRWRVPAWFAVGLVVLIVAFGRVHAGAHWPSQTLGGLLGAATLLGALRACLVFFAQRVHRGAEESKHGDRSRQAHS
jgi:undecaprenyl-diphosphatase